MDREDDRTNQELDALAVEMMTDEDRARQKDLKRRRGELEVLKRKYREAWQCVAFSKELLSFHGCKSHRELPGDAFELLLARSGSLLSEADKEELRAYHRGEIEPEARLPKLMSRLEKEWLESASGTKQ